MRDIKSYFIGDRPLLSQTQKVKVMTSITVICCLGILTSCGSTNPIELNAAIKEATIDINDLYFREMNCPHFGLLLSDVSVVFKVKGEKGGKLTVDPNVKSFVTIGSGSFSSKTSRSNTITIKFTNFLPGLLASAAKAPNGSKGSVLGTLLINSGSPSEQSPNSKKLQKELREKILKVLSFDLNMNDKDAMVKNNCVSQSLITK